MKQLKFKPLVSTTILLPIREKNNKLSLLLIKYLFMVKKIKLTL